jgi:hypothetical protein
LFVDVNGGAILFFIIFYAPAAAAAIIAPSYKGITATLVALAGMALMLPDLGHPVDQDPDALNPHLILLGTISGGAVAVCLAFLRLRPRWLLILPAYVIGWDIGFVLGLWICSFGGIFNGPGWNLWLCLFITTLSVASAFGILLAAWTAPVHRKLVAVCLSLLSVGLIAYCSWAGG